MRQGQPQGLPLQIYANLEYYFINGVGATLVVALFIITPLHL
jgi:hypothetical protein